MLPPTFGHPVSDCETPRGCRGECLHALGPGPGRRVGGRPLRSKPPVFPPGMRPCDCLILPFGLRTGRPPTEVQIPQPTKSARESARRGAGQKRGARGSALGKVLVLLVPRRDTRGNHFSEHFPEHPVSGRHLSSGTKNQPKEEVFGTDIPRTSGGHSRGHPGPKLRSGRSKSWKKNKHFGADIQDPKARTSIALRGFQKLRSEKLWAEFSFPISEHSPEHFWGAGGFALL